MSVLGFMFQSLHFHDREKLLARQMSPCSQNHLLLIKGTWRKISIYSLYHLFYRDGRLIFSFWNSLKNLTKQLATVSEEKLALEEKLKTAEEKLGAVEENLQVKKIIISSYISFSFP